MVMTEKHHSLIQAARNKYGHIKKCPTVKSLSDGFRDTIVGPVLWFNDSNDSTHIASSKDLCPQCGSPLNFPTIDHNGYCTHCNNINN
jgi:hypothetical protein